MLGMDQMLVFDRAAVRLHRDRAAATVGDVADILRDAAERLLDRLDDTTRVFTRALDIGGRGVVAPILRERGIETVSCDLSPAMAALNGGPAVTADEEFLPFAPASFDLIVASLSLHWVNDLPGALAQIRRILRPDGLLLASLLGGRTLEELRLCLLEAESEVAGGASPRVSPSMETRDAGALLQRAGFALPVADADLIDVSYPDALALMRDLRGMGETNATAGRTRRFTRREVVLRAAAIYARRFARPDGRIRASFEIVTLTGWAPAPSQPQPLRPGSAAARLADALGVAEIPAGDKAPRG
jgi:SAM-dependent methyltransferase